MKLALCQMANAGTIDMNLEKSIAAVREAVDHHADLILFPEVQLTEFFPQYPGQDVSAYRTELDLEQAKRIRNSKNYTNLRRTEFYK